MNLKQYVLDLLFITAVAIGCGFSSLVAYAKNESLALLTAFQPSLVVLERERFLPPSRTPEDERIERIARLNRYFEKYNMPLAGYGEKFVEVADKCDIDWRLLPAIGVRESSGGKYLMNNNPFGWGSAKIRFVDFNDAIEKVSDNLCGLNPGTARYYKDKSTYKRLWYYNGTVMPSYPYEVMEIMDRM